MGWSWSCSGRSQTCPRSQKCPRPQTCPGPTHRVPFHHLPFVVLDHHHHLGLEGDDQHRSLLHHLPHGQLQGQRIPWKTAHSCRFMEEHPVSHLPPGPDSRSSPRAPLAVQSHQFRYYGKAVFPKNFPLKNTWEPSKLSPNRCEFFCYFPKSINLGNGNELCSIISN